MKRLGELSDLVGGHLTAEPDLEIYGAASISRAGTTEITFVTSPQYFKDFLQSDAIAAVIGFEVESSCSKPVILVDDVTCAFIEIAEVFKPPILRENAGVSPQAHVSSSVILGDDVCIHPGAVVMDNVEIATGAVIFPNATVMENCKIGAHTRIFPNAVLYENTVVGDRSIIHSGAVLGAFGFGYKSNTGRHELSAQLGNVVIGDDVEIGANTTVDRGTYDSTMIQNGTKIDNLVMVGHNCVIGEHNLLCSQVGIAGSCTTGDFVVMGGQVGLADHLDIGSNVSIGAKSGLMHSIEPDQKVFGIPARPAREEMQLLAAKAKLPELRKTVKRLAKQVETLAQSQKSNSGETRAA
ncbi:MAG: UDP-3-O-[3-hydroxymyristoyl] glucosamine N-acyltransferase [Mariniblastus sp.]|jgi:UDP-3-O-[3-hydroxymyristoyl] glucosamine N-acyltransferase